jgi:hypothetical protein
MKREGKSENVSINEGNISGKVVSPSNFEMELEKKKFFYCNRKVSDNVGLVLKLIQKETKNKMSIMMSLQAKLLGRQKKMFLCRKNSKHSMINSIQMFKICQKEVKYPHGYKASNKRKIFGCSISI